MEILQAIFSNTIVAFILLIGVVIFVHELGHFLAGKAFGVEVEEFSIGFGPKAFSIRKGNTDYQINWLPLGGYVKFYGSNLEENVPFEKYEKSILHAKVYKRAIISFAGPLANFILSLFIMTILSIYGLPKQPPIISVLPNSVAEKAGLKSGDRVLEIDKVKINAWSDLSYNINKSPEKNLTLLVNRNGLNQYINVTPRKETNETIFGNQQTTGIIGVSHFFTSSHVFVAKNSFLDVIGLQTGDKIVQINDKKIEYFYQILNSLEEITQTKSQYLLAQKINNGSLDQQKITFQFMRNKNEQKSILVLFSNKKIKDWAEQFVKLTENQNLIWAKDILSSDQTISTFPKLENHDKQLPIQDAWKSCGLSEGDTLFSIDNLGRIYSLLQFEFWKDASTKNLSNDVKKSNKINVNLQVINKNGERKILNCQIPLRAGFDHLNRKQIYLDFPVQYTSQNLFIPNETIKASSIIEAIKTSLLNITNQVYLTFKVIKMLFTGTIPLANLGGPIAIATVAGEAAKNGIIIFLMTLAFISTNIGMMNLLPLPALDGGHLLLQAIEAAYGKPLPKSVQITVQRIGIFIILSLFCLVFYNDILRLIRF